MKNLLVLFFLIGSYFSYSQVDYSATWEDFYSYNNVKDLIKVDQKIYALCDNAVFIYDTNTSSVKIAIIN